jgi:hypothetical protein
VFQRVNVKAEFGPRAALAAEQSYGVVPRLPAITHALDQSNASASTVSWILEDAVQKFEDWHRE